MNIVAYSMIERFARLLLVVPIVAIVLVVFVIILLTFKNWLITAVAGKISDRQAQQRKIGPDGKPYPPCGRGLCDICEKADDKICYLPSGRRLCKKCYDKAVTGES